jgi:PAS domain-containing protein
MHWLSTIKLPFPDRDGTIVGTFGVSRDITEREHAEEALRQANARLELALSGSNVGVWDNEMRYGDYRNGPRHYVKVWEQLGYEGLRQVEGVSIQDLGRKAQSAVGPEGIVNSRAEGLGCLIDQHVCSRDLA